MSNWTQEDERRFNEMAVRRGLVLGKRRESVDRAANHANLYGARTSDELVELLIAHADILRDALQPYDSGIRVAEHTGEHS